MQILVAKSKVVLTPLKSEVSSEGFIIPEGQDEKTKPEIGIIHQIGTGERPVKMEVGDKLVYGKYMETRTNINGQEYITIDFKDCLFVIEDEKKNKAAKS